MKKLMKKISNAKGKIAGLLVGIACFMFAIVYSFAEKPTKLTITPDKTTANHGDTIVYTVRLETQQEHNGIRYIINFNPDELEYVSSTLSTDYMSNEFKDNIATGKINWSHMLANAYKNSDVELGTITFRVKDGASGNTKVFLSDHEVSRTDIGTYDIEELETEIVEPQQVFVNVPVNQDSIVLKSDVFKIDMNTAQKTANLEIDYLPKNTTDAKNFTYQVISGSDVVEVSNDGVITAKKVGTATIQVTAFGKTMTATVTVVAPLKGISLNKGQIEVDFNNLPTETLSIITDPNPTSDIYTVAWSTTDNSVVSVNNGALTFHKKGTATIKAIATVTATGTTFEASANVTVKAKATSISIVGGNFELNKTGVNTSKQLVANTTPAAVDDITTWESSDLNVARVDSNGNVTAVGGGTATIKATSGTVSDSVTVTVKVPATGISVDVPENETITLVAPQTRTINATVEPADATDKTITWSSSNTAVATVNNGVVTAIAPGTATIKATIGNITVERNVKVLIPISNVVMDTPSATLDLSNQKTITLQAKILPDDAEEKKDITWSSSDKTVATVNNGVVTAVGKGTATITAELENGKKATSTITVIASVVSVKLNQSAIELSGIGSKETLSVIFNPTDPTNKTVTWETSDASVATVNNGEVTAVGKGTATIKVTTADGGHVATAQVTVVIPTTSVAITGNKKLELEVGNTQTLVATVLPVGTSDTLSWKSSDPSIVTVSQSGVISAKAPGKAVITAISGTKQDSIEVNVVIKIQSFTLVSNNTVEILRKNESIVSTEIAPSNATEDKTITWTSDDEDIAVVKDGVITGVKEGTTIVRGTLKNGMSVSVNVTVKIIPLTNIEVKEPKIEILRKAGKYLALNFEPANTTELDQVEWTSEDETIATVENGIVIGKKAGTTKITATYKGLTTTAEVTITEIPLDGIKIINTNNNLEVGKTMQLNVALEPADSTDDVDYIYESSDNEIATVDANGNITAKKEGKVVITVTANNQFKATYELNITTPKNPNTGENIFFYVTTLIVGTFMAVGLLFFKKFNLVRKGL